MKRHLGIVLAALLAVALPATVLRPTRGDHVALAAAARAPLEVLADLEALGRGLRITGIVRDLEQPGVLWPAHHPGHPW